MNTNPRNDCPPDGHEWIESPWEPGLQACAWPGCTATRETPAVPVPGVDVPTQRAA